MTENRSRRNTSNKKRNYTKKRNNYNKRRSNNNRSKTNDNNYVVIELKAINKIMQEQQIVQVNKYFKELKKENIIPNYGILINFPQPNAKETKKTIDFKIIKNNVN